MLKRGNGILLHITSLPGKHGIGDLGPGAYEFVDFLERAGQSYWQILPLTLTDSYYGNSPYSSISAFAGNDILISAEMLLEEGLISKNTLNDADFKSCGRCDYDKAAFFKHLVFEEAFKNFRQQGLDPTYEVFRQSNGYWIEELALFKVAKDVFGYAPWYDWPKGMRDREEKSLQVFKKQYAENIDKEIFKQFIFDKQWFRLKEYSNSKGVQLIGDMPIYVIWDSVEVWKHPEIFQLDDSGNPTAVAGVPPDYFSNTGQLWGNPLYDWDVLKRTGYTWWVERLKRNFKLYDMTRIDHFRGLIAYWQIPAGSETAVDGRWQEVPFEDFFSKLQKRFAYLPIIVEDLGTITPDVREAVNKYDLPGMKVLLFAFGDDDPKHPYLPHMYPRNCVAYTGVHDTNTLRGWYENELNNAERARVMAYLGTQSSEDRLNWEFMRILMRSPAAQSIIPMQDLLFLSEECRMNHPAKKKGNWEWKLRGGELDEELTRTLADMTRLYGRV